MKTSGNIFIVGVGPETFPSISLHGTALLGRCKKVIVDFNVAPQVADFFFDQVESRTNKNLEYDKVDEVTPEMFLTEGDILWIRKVADWGMEPAVPDFLQGRRVILEPLPPLAKGVLVRMFDGVHKGGVLFSPYTLIAPASLGKKQKASDGLAGRRVVVTRAQAQSDSFVEELRFRGALPIEIPSIRIETHPDHAGIVEAIAGLNGYDWSIFSSANGVDMFFDIFFRRFKDMRDFGGARIAAVGPATAARLEALHLQVDVVPKVYTGKEVAKTIDKFDSLENRRILLVRPEKGSADLPRVLEDAGAIVDDIPFYCTVSESKEMMENPVFRSGGADWITFCSPSAVNHFHAKYDLLGVLSEFSETRIASIGPETTRALVSLKITPTVEANPHTVQALIEAMERHEKG